MAQGARGGWPGAGVGGRSAGWDTGQDGGCVGSWAAGRVFAWRRLTGPGNFLVGTDVTSGDTRKGLWGGRGMPHRRGGGPGVQVCAALSGVPGPVGLRDSRGFGDPGELDPRHLRGGAPDTPGPHQALCVSGCYCTLSPVSDGLILSFRFHISL